MIVRSLIRRQWPGELVRAAIYALLLLWGGGLSGAVFLRIDGIPGESQGQNREDWIDVVSLGAEARSDHEDLATSRTTGALKIRKRIDKSSPYLVEAVLKGMVLPDMRVEIEEAGGVEAMYRFNSVRVTSHSLSTLEAQAGGGLLEEFTFVFDVAEWYDVRRIANLTERVGSTWNFATNEGGILNGPQVDPPSIAPIAPPVVNPGDVFEVTVQLRDPSQNPDQLVFSVLSSDVGRVRVRSITGTGLTRTLTVEAGLLENGVDELTLNLTDGVRSSTRRMAVLIDGARTEYEAYLRGALGNQTPDDPNDLRPVRDPDGDNLSNIMEFYLGTDPFRETPRNEAFTMRSRVRPGGTEVVFNYFRRESANGLRENFEGATNLGEWFRMGGNPDFPLQVEQVGVSTNGYAPMSARVLLPPGQERFFMRLTVSGSLR